MMGKDDTGEMLELLRSIESNQRELLERKKAEDMALAGVGGFVAGSYIGKKLFGGENGLAKAFLFFLAIVGFVSLLVMIGLPWLIYKKRHAFREHPVTMTSASALVGMFYAIVILVLADPSLLNSTSFAMPFGTALFVDLLIFLIAATVVLIQRHQSKGRHGKRRARKA
jgi:cytochrome bd-type quinol oxidase subunit 2